MLRIALQPSTTPTAQYPNVSTKTPKRYNSHEKTIISCKIDIILSWYQSLLILKMDIGFGIILNSYTDSEIKTNMETFPFCRVLVRENEVTREHSAIAAFTNMV